MFSVDSIRQRYGVTEGTVLGWIRTGDLKAINVGRKIGSKRPRWRVSQAAIDAFEAARTTAATPARTRTMRRAAPQDVVRFYA
jgi:transposase